VVVVVWDTVLDPDCLPIEHRIYVCSSPPQENYCYKTEFRESRLNDSLLRAFVIALQARGYIADVPVQIFNDTAFRAKFREIFLLDMDYGPDVACTAYMALSTIYMSLVENAVTAFNDDPHPFATFDTKRVWRFLTKCFHYHLRRTLVEEIQTKGNAVWMPAAMREAAVDIRKVHLVSVNTHTGDKTILEYQGPTRGFIRR
jgi:hypothetical protein